MIAMGPMFALVSSDRQGEYTPRTITSLLSLYRRSNSSNYYPVTQCLAAVLQAAPTTAIEPLFDQLLPSLGSMVMFVLIESVRASQRLSVEISYGCNVPGGSYARL